MIGLGSLHGRPWGGVSTISTASSLNRPFLSFLKLTKQVTAVCPNFSIIAPRPRYGRQQRGQIMPSVHGNFAGGNPYRGMAQIKRHERQQPLRPSSSHKLQQLYEKQGGRLLHLLLVMGEPYATICNWRAWRIFDSTRLENILPSR
jgi:hypothetical protein